MAVVLDESRSRCPEEEGTETELAAVVELGGGDGRSRCPEEEGTETSVALDLRRHDHVEAVAPKKRGLKLT